MFGWLTANRQDDPDVRMKSNEQHCKVLQVPVEWITEMAAVNRKSAGWVNISIA